MKFKKSCFTDNKKDKVKEIKEQLENGTYDWEDAIEDASEIILDSIIGEKEDE